MTDSPNSEQDVVEVEETETEVQDEVEVTVTETEGETEAVEAEENEESEDDESEDEEPVVAKVARREHEHFVTPAYVEMVVRKREEAGAFSSQKARNEYRKALLVKHGLPTTAKEMKSWEKAQAEKKAARKEAAKAERKAARDAAKATA